MAYFLLSWKFAVYLVVIFRDDLLLGRNFIEYGLEYSDSTSVAKIEDSAMMQKVENRGQIFLI